MLFCSFACDCTAAPTDESVEHPATTAQSADKPTIARNFTSGILSHSRKFHDAFEF